MSYFYIHTIPKVLVKIGESFFRDGPLVVVGLGWVVFAGVLLVHIETTKNLTIENVRP